MARKLIRTTRVGPKCAVKIYRDSEYRVFVVKTSHGAKSTEYETDDKKDARGTAAQQARWLKKQPSCRRF